MRQHLSAVVRWCGDAAVRWWLPVRVALASYWTAGIAWVVMTALHGRWLWRSAHAGDVLSAYGAGMVVLGVLIGSRPYLGTSLTATAERMVGDMRLGAFVKGAIRDALVAENLAALIAERVVAVALVIVGTLLNGWGTPLARRWHLPV